jgi:hypothetical protein
MDFTQWTWVDRFRVWQANRKVFVYPENWIEPEQRDDESAKEQGQVEPRTEELPPRD